MCTKKTVLFTYAGCTSYWIVLHSLPFICFVFLGTFCPLLWLPNLCLTLLMGRIEGRKGEEGMEWERVVQTFAALNTDKNNMPVQSVDCA